VTPINKAVFFPICLRNTADSVVALASRSRLTLEIQLSADAPLRDCRDTLANRVIPGRMQRQNHGTTISQLSGQYRSVPANIAAFRPISQHSGQYRSIPANIAACRLLKQTRKSCDRLAPRCLSILTALDCGLERCHRSELAIRCRGTAFPLVLPERVIPI